MQQPGGGFRLIVRRGPQPNQIYDLTKEVMTLGRDITNDITINDPEVSRHHARLTRQGDTYLMEDLGSTNGTFINGQRLSGPRPLIPGETIGLGETVTLAYESSAFVAPAQPQYAPPAYAPPGSQPQQQQPYAPPAQVPPPAAPPVYEQQPPQVAPSPYAPPGMQQGYMPMYGEQPPAPYGGYVEEEPRRGGMGRWLLLGCGCFIVLCVLGSVIGLIAIDQTCAWKEEPLSSIVEGLGFEPSETFAACQ